VASNARAEARAEEEEGSEDAASNARAEEEEDSEGAASDAREEDVRHPKAVIKAAPDANATQRAIQELLENLRRGHAPKDKSPQSPVDRALSVLRNRAALSEAQEMLLQKSQDKSLDVVFRARVCAMLGVLNLFLDQDISYSWRKASMVVAKAQGHGVARARKFRKWILDFVQEGRLPVHLYCYSWESILGDEGILQEIQEQLIERAKGSFIKAQDMCEIVASERVQSLCAERGIDKSSISLATAHRWLAKLEWRYGKKSNGMYFDGHEREDVMAYREAFVNRWAEYETRFHFWDDNGNLLSSPSHSFPLILVTHDELIFYQNDERKTRWGHQASQPAPIPKGEGQSLMVSDFLTAEWGRLRDGDRCVNPFFFVVLSANHSTERPVSCSNRGRTVMVSLIRKNSLPKSIVQSTSSITKQMASLRASSCSITRPVT
jgi:hypothetical protein